MGIRGPTRVSPASGHANGCPAEESDTEGLLKAPEMAVGVIRIPSPLPVWVLTVSQLQRRLENAALCTKLGHEANLSPGRNSDHNQNFRFQALCSWWKSAPL